MTEFHVEYRIEVDADTAEEAARKVADILGDGGAARGAYHVMPYVMPTAELLREGEEIIDLDERDERECSRCGDEVLVLNSQDECAGCEERAAGLSKAARRALAELERDGYVYEVAGGRFRASGIAPGKHQYSRATIAELSEYQELTGHSYSAWKKAGS